MALGTALAVFPGRKRRNPLQAASAPVPGLSRGDGDGDDEAGPDATTPAEPADEAAPTVDDERVEVEV
jgi:hypothetical protein